jgi:glutathione S-transferase
MQLVGLLDSPYVRRVAISLQLLGLPFEHRPVSVFRGFDAFRAINPVVKAPTLVCDDGAVLMDSSLILEYAEALAAPRATLIPRDIASRRQCLCTLGFALAACEKAVQLVYEHELRPPEHRHEPWTRRVRAQLRAAAAGLERELASHPPSLDAVDQGTLTSAVTWHFVQQLLPAELDVAAHPTLAALSAGAETLPAFAAAPHGPDRVDPAISTRSAT